MKSEKEIRELKKTLEILTAFISECGTEKDFDDKDVGYSCNVEDALSWVLDEITTDDFQSDSYLNMSNLKETAENIEKRTGKNKEDSE